MNLPSTRSEAAIRRGQGRKRIMKLTAEIAGETHQVEVKTEGDRVVAEIDGRRVVLEARRTESGLYLLIAGDRVYECRVDPTDKSGGAVDVYVGPRRYPVSLSDPKRLRGAHTTGAHQDGSAQIVAPMPGKVVRVLVELNAEVAEGDGVVVVEAMKMQNELKSPRAGIVVELHAEAGATVDAGDVLAVVE